MKIVSSEQKALLTKYRARQHQMLLVYWGPDYMDPHTNADSFARNPDNSDDPKTKPLAWRNSWDIPEITKMADAAVRERDEGKREQMYKDLQKKVMDEGPFIIMFQETKQVAERANVKNFVMGPSPGRHLLQSDDEIKTGHGQHHCEFNSGSLALTA